MPSLPADRGSPDTCARPLALVAVSLLAVALWLARSALAGPRFGFLFWNLFLAWVPWLLTLPLARVRTPLAFWALLASWLAFFPNAPYLLTDLVHLKARPPVPHAFDVLFLATFAQTGCLLGWDSLSRVHAALQARAGGRLATAFIIAAVLLCGVGVFLGRFERLNSWELVTNPLEVALITIEALQTQKARLYSLAFAGFVGAGYLFTRASRSVSAS